MTENLRNDASTKNLKIKDPRRARSVVARQGQVLLDSEVNAGVGLTLDRIEDGTLDTLGQTAVKAGSDAFKVTNAGNILSLGTGRIYVDGLLVENRPAGGAATCLFTAQPHPPANIPAAPPTGLVGLKVVVRHVDPAEDDAIIEPALGDATSAGRSLNDWQAFLVPAAGATCGMALPAWDQMIAPSTGMLSARALKTDPATSPCAINPGGGYTRLENLLYRVEVHGGTAVQTHADGKRFGLNGLKLKVSRNNASVMARIVKVAGEVVTLDPPALDPLNWFAQGAYAEVVSIHADVDATRDRPALFAVAEAGDDTARLSGLPGGLIPVDGAGKPTAEFFLRLWDRDLITVAVGGGAQQSDWIDIGDGITIRVHNGLFRDTDHWTFAARSALGEIDWPRDAAQNPLAQKPHGPVVHYARLAAITSAGGTITSVEDCRPEFVPLAEQVTLVYRGGDGQTAFLGDTVGGFTPLRAKLRVGAVRAQLPLQGARIRWQGKPGNPIGTRVSGAAAGPIGPGNPTVTTTTDAVGLSELTWELSAAQPDQPQFIQAVLLDAANNPIGPPLEFSAIYATAARTSYQDGDCSILMGAETVQEALDRLCEAIPKEKPDSLKLQRPFFLQPVVIKDDEIVNAELYDAVELAGGIGFEISGQISTKPRPFDPLVDVELELPYPTTREPRQYWNQATRSDPQKDDGLLQFFATQRIRLAGRIALEKGEGSTFLTWKPTQPARGFIVTALRHQFGQRPVFGNDEKWDFPKEPDPILCRLRVRGALLWQGKEPRDSLYLNAEGLGFDGRTPLELSFKEPDPQRAADLEMFFYLEAKQGWKQQTRPGGNVRPGGAIDRLSRRPPQRVRRPVRPQPED